LEKYNVSSELGAFIHDQYSFLIYQSLVLFGTILKKARQSSKVI
jgi:hypothetical protein